MGTRKRVIYGDQAEVLALRGLSTAYVERSPLTSRLSDSRLVCKTFGYSKTVEMHRAVAAWDDVVYALVRSHKAFCLRVFDDPNRRGLLV